MTKQDLLAGGLENVSQAAKCLGVNLNTLYRWIKRGHVPCTCIDGVFHIPSRAVDDLPTIALNIGKKVSA